MKAYVHNKKGSVSLDDYLDIYGNVLGDNDSYGIFGDHDHDD